MQYIEEEITLAEFAERFLELSDFSTPDIYDTSELGVEVLGKNVVTGDDEYRKINSFVVKNSVGEYYSDGQLYGTANHRVIENGRDIKLKKHQDFIKYKGKMQVVDIEVDNIHNYYANNRLNHNTTPGGKALPFHASVRIRLKKIGQVKDSKRKIDDVIGIKCKAQVIKSRVGPPLRQAEFNILFDSGIDDMSSWLITMKDFDMIKQGGAWYTYVDTDSGDEYKFQAKDFSSLLDKNVKLKEQIYQRICDARIMKYKTRDGTVDDNKIEDNDQ